MAWRARAHNFLMVRATDKKGPQTARVDLFEFEFSARVNAQWPARPRLIDRAAIGARRQRHVVGVLVAPLNF